jgi:dienelactone hydrolase
MVALCGDAKAAIPGACMTYGAMAAAKQGALTLRIENITPGRYAIQAFHDENGNFRPDMPVEGFAFGNDAAWPPAFNDAAMQIDGDAHAALKMSYMAAGSAASTTQRAAAAPSEGAPPPEGMTRTDVRQNGLYGEFYAPRTAGPKPALLLIGGSEGGIDTISQMATSFAKAGYPTLALAYWNLPGLPASLENIPLEYFDRAIAWLKQQPQVKASAIGMLGWSRGAEAALLVASRNSSIRLAIAVAPSGVVWQGLNFTNMTNRQPAWTVNGRPLPWVAPQGSDYRPDQALAQMFTAAFETMESRPDAAIPVERIHGDVLLISGGADRIWPSTRFADRIVARLQALNFKGSVLHLDYPEAGHALFVGEPDGLMARAVDGGNAMMGGTPQANAQARADSWRRTLAFVQARLNGAQ